MALADSDHEEEEDGPTVYGKTSHDYLKWGTYYTFLIIALPFIFLIPQYSHQFRVGVKESWTDTFYSLFTSNPDYFSAEGSAIGDQFEFYSTYNWPITLHTIAGPVWLFCGFIQFNNYIRSNYIKIHRISGYCYFIALLLSLIGSISMLTLQIITGEKLGDVSKIFSENGAYHIYLFFYWAAGVITGVGGLYAIKQKEVPQHRQWMTFNFSLAVAAAVLRILWVSYSWIYPNKTMLEINLITFQWMVVLAIIPSVYIISLGDVENERGFKRFLTRNIENQRSNKALAGFIVVLVLNTLCTGVLGGIEFVGGKLSMYEWIGYDTAKHTGQSSIGLIIFWALWLVGTYLNIVLLWYYRFDHNSWFYARYFSKYFIFVTIWNLITCVVSIVNAAALNAFYEGIVENKAFFKNVEWFWVVSVTYIVITNLQSLYYYFFKKDMERCYEWMCWMVYCSGLCFVIRYLYVFIMCGFFKILYGKRNLQDLVISGYTSYFEMAYVLGLFWMIMETQSVKQKNKYEMVQTMDDV